KTPRRPRQCLHADDPTTRSGLRVPRDRHVRLKKIDCVMIRVADTRTAAEFYTGVFGLHRSWEDDTAIGLVFPESDAEIVVHTDANIPSDVEVHYMVDDVVEATEAFVAGGCRILVKPLTSSSESAPLSPIRSGLASAFWIQREGHGRRLSELASAIWSWPVAPLAGAARQRTKGGLDMRTH